MTATDSFENVTERYAPPKTKLPDLYGKILYSKNDIEKMKRGVIYYNNELPATSFTAHEFGHAAQEATPGFFNKLQRFNLGKVNRGLMFANPFISYIVGKKTDSPESAALTGAGIGAAIGAPTLLNELRASQLANRFINSPVSNLSKSLKFKNKAGLLAAFLTYLTATAGLGAGAAASSKII